MTKQIYSRVILNSEDDLTPDIEQLISDNNIDELVINYNTSYEITPLNRDGISYYDISQMDNYEKIYSEYYLESSSPFRNFKGKKVNFKISIGKDVTSLKGLFAFCFYLKQAPHIDLSKVKDTSGMFFMCFSLTTVPLYKLQNTNRAISMFALCKKIKKIPPIVTPNLKFADGMFEFCLELTEMPYIDYSNIESMMGIFSDCYNLKIRKINFPKNCTYGYMFESSLVDNIKGEFKSNKNNYKTKFLRIRNDIRQIYGNFFPGLSFPNWIFDDPKYKNLTLDDIFSIFVSTNNACIKKKRDEPKDFIDNYLIDDNPWCSKITYDNSFEKKAELDYGIEHFSSFMTDNERIPLYQVEYRKIICESKKYKPIIDSKEGNVVWFYSNIAKDILSKSLFPKIELPNAKFNNKFIEYPSYSKSITIMDMKIIHIYAVSLANTSTLEDRINILLKKLGFNDTGITVGNDYLFELKLNESHHKIQLYVNQFNGEITQAIHLNTDSENVLSINNYTFFMNIVLFAYFKINTGFISSKIKFISNLKGLIYGKNNLFKNQNISLHFDELIELDASQKEKINFVRKISSLYC